jgi:hypothetical protein
MPGYTVTTRDISIVKFCLRNFALPSLGRFDASPGDKSDNMWGCFDFAAPPRLGVPRKNLPNQAFVPAGA